MNQNRKIFQDINRENILKSKQNSNNQNPQLLKNETCPSLDVKTQIFEEKLKKLENKSTEIFKSKIPNLDDLNFIYNFFN